MLCLAVFNFVDFFSAIPAAPQKNLFFLFLFAVSESSLRFWTSLVVENSSCDSSLV